MKIVIHDANILIDLEIAGLLESWQQLGHETHTTDGVVQQLTDGGHRIALAHIRAGAIRERTFTFEEITEIGELMAECGSGPNFTDCSLLYLAVELRACLLTGDQRLRREVEKRELEVHGTLWIFDSLVESGILAERLAAEKLRCLLEQDRFLPAAECDQRLAKWSR